MMLMIMWSRGYNSDDGDPDERDDDGEEEDGGREAR